MLLRGDGRGWGCTGYYDQSPTSCRCAMPAITITLSEGSLQRLRKLAERAGVSPEDLARAGLEDCLARPREDFAKAAEHVLRKNAELYRRLA